MHCTLHAPFFIFIPKPMYKNDYPDLVIELKWNKAAKTAVEQIRNRKYTQVLEQFAGDILLPKRQKASQIITICEASPLFSLILTVAAFIRLLCF